MWMGSFLVLGELTGTLIAHLVKPNGGPPWARRAALELCEPQFGLAITQSVKELDWTVTSYKAICSVLTVMVSEPTGVSYE